MDGIITEDFVQSALQGELKSLERQRSLLSNRVSSLNRLLDEKSSEVETYKKALDQERLMKESAIGKLTRLKFYDHLPSGDVLNLDGNAEYERRKRKLELELVEEELQRISSYQKALIEMEKKVNEKDRRLTACQDEIYQLETKIRDQEQAIQRLKLNLITTHLFADKSSEPIDNETKLDVQISTDEDEDSYWKRVARLR